MGMALKNLFDFSEHSLSDVGSFHCRTDFGMFVYFGIIIFLKDA